MKKIWCYLTTGISCLLLGSGLSLHAQSWTLAQKLVNQDREPNDEFGNAVAIDGSYALVAASREDHDTTGMDAKTDAGSVYVFHHDGSAWTQEQKLVPQVRSGAAFFGHDVDIHGTYAIVGAPSDGLDSSLTFTANAGSAIVFERNASTGKWEEVAKLLAPVRKANDYFGHSVAIHGEFALVGAYFEDEDENEMNEVLSAGSAYLFKRNAGSGAWEFYQKIVANDRAQADRFGWAVDLYEEFALVGSDWNSLDTAGGSVFKAGSAYLFKKDGNEDWVQQAQYEALDAKDNDRLGSAVAVNDSFLVLGAFQHDYDDTTGQFLSDAGAVYVYRHAGPGAPQAYKLVASDRAQIDFFGFSVGLSGQRVVVGAYRHNLDTLQANPKSDAGAAYVYSYDPSTDRFIGSQKLIHSVRDALDQFGFSVAIDQNWVIGGATLEDTDPNEENPRPDAGAAYAFSLSNPNTYIARSQAEPLSVQVYPNPNSGHLYLKLSEQVPNVQIKVYSLSGQQLQSIQRTAFQQGEIDLGPLARGVYQIQVQTGTRQGSLRLQIR